MREERLCLQKRRQADWAVEKPRPKPSQAEEQGQMTQVLKPERVVEQFLGEPEDEFVRVKFPKAFGLGQPRQSPEA